MSVETPVVFAPTMSEPPKIGSVGRVSVRGKFLAVGDERFDIKGVTYGPFRPDDSGNEYGPRDRVADDFAKIAANGFNTVRLYTVPQRWLLDEAAAHGLRVMVGLPWEQHIAFLETRAQARAIERGVREGVRACAEHPAVLAFAIGNEIPASIVRWHGRRRIERFLRRLARAVRAESPSSLVTYVNFPTTEYLRLSFCDFVCFNVYLENRESFDRYLARLHNVAGDRPVVIAELGLDTQRNGVARQAEQLSEQSRAVWRSGGAGVFLFAWTDEWHRGGCDIEDWAFGLTDRDRRPKPALAAVSGAFAEAPLDFEGPWPKISVVVCSYNGAATIEETCERLHRIDYPDFEVIVVNDGSTDRTRKIVECFPFRLINLENGGLSHARNVGMREATGRIVAYIDDDAYPDPQWLRYVAWTFMNTDHAAVGGPNLPPPGDGRAADCVANAPGGPTHVLLDDVTAEHIPGCNMAFRKSCLESIGGFDTRFRIAGDDVDVCWRLLEEGWTIGYHPGAFVWHHRRASVRTYLRQQKNYGRAEAMLEQKWPTKYNVAGHVPWTGRIYGRGMIRSLMSLRQHVYQGIWGSAPFQRLYERESTVLSALPMMPEWYLITAVLALLVTLGMSWPPLFMLAPLLAVALLIPIAQAVMAAMNADFADRIESRTERWRRRALITFLHLAQPPARLFGRVREGLTPWRKRRGRWARPGRQSVEIWRDEWTEPHAMLQSVEDRVMESGLFVVHGGEYDDWDLTIRGGLLGSTRIRMAVEEHGQGRQYFRFDLRPVWFRLGGVLAIALATVAVLAAASFANVAYTVLAIAAITLELRVAYECGLAQRLAKDSINDSPTSEDNADPGNQELRDE